MKETEQGQVQLGQWVSKGFTFLYSRYATITFIRLWVLPVRALSQWHVWRNSSYNPIWKEVVSSFISASLCTLFCGKYETLDVVLECS